uniref:Uncharacterized protein n=1 Tax=Solanum lycopersicum TaxID=4081 RepID=A0A3Q7HP77_SOLLC
MRIWNTLSKAESIKVSHTHFISNEIKSCDIGYMILFLSENYITLKRRVSAF